jgi:hypothetical protein
MDTNISVRGVQPRLHPCGVPLAHKRSKGYKGKLYPYGGFTGGYDCASDKQAKHNNTVSERNYQARIQTHKDFEAQYYTYKLGDNEVQIPLSEDLSGILKPHELVHLRDEARAAAARLKSSRSVDLTMLSISHKRKRKGLKGISVLGKHTVKSAAALMEQKYGRRRLGFNTVTIPPLPNAIRQLLHENWSYFVKLFVQTYKRILIKNKATSDSMIVVSEIQEKRYKKYGELNLHLHIVALGNDGKGRYYINPNQLKSLVKSTIFNLIKKYSKSDYMGAIKSLEDVNWRCCADMQTVKKSVVSYIGKYLSKGVKALQDIAPDDLLLLPKQWWYCTKAVKNAVKTLTLRLDVSAFASMIQRLPYYQESNQLLYFNIFEKPLEKITLTFYTGQFNRILTNDFLGIDAITLGGMTF